MIFNAITITEMLEIHNDKHTMLMV